MSDTKIDKNSNIMQDAYLEFLEDKIVIAENYGFEPNTTIIPDILKPHQKDIVNWCIEGGRRAIFASFGLGKCHGIGTQIMMSDCSFKNVEDVKVGDQIMGDDGTPRNVKSLARGVDEMFKITLKNKDSYVCNGDHIMSLMVSNKYKEYKKGDIVNMSVREFLDLPNYVQRNCYKHYKRPLNFKRQNVYFDPYIYGLWLGDGLQDNVAFCINNRDTELVSEIYNFADFHGMRKRVENGRGCKTHFLNFGHRGGKPYVQKEFVKASANECGKFIRREYLINDRSTRLNLLAGILDSDGYLIDKCYELVTKWEGLRDDYLFLIRSLGFSVTHAIKTVNDVDYYRIYISGDTHLIPCRGRKKAGQRKQIKNPLVYGFDIEPLGFDQYYGFEIDGNHLYMLSDFTVTHNTVMQLELASQVIHKTQKPFLISLPLGVVGEFKRDNEFLNEYRKKGFEIDYITNTSTITEVKPQIYVTNYERIRKGDIDPNLFGGVSFDEASILRNLNTETTNYVLQYFKKIPYRFVATATPTPNDFIEILNYADYLGVIERGHALTRFFKRDSTKAGNLTLYDNKKAEFWQWVSTWAVFINKPSDLGYDDIGYDLPKMHLHEIEVTRIEEGEILDKKGKLTMFRDNSKSLLDVSREKRATIDIRIQKAAEIVRSKPNENWILWHHLNDERDAISKELLTDFELRSVYGSQKHHVKEQNLIDFSNGEYQILSTKPKIAGSGCNFQHACHNMIFVGIDYKFNDFIQAIHRVYRFKQDHEVNIYIIHTNNERHVLKTLKEKWRKHVELQSEMINLVRNYGLNANKIKSDMKRQIFDKIRTHKVGEATVFNDDTVNQHRQMKDNSVDMILTSIPFGDHYEYSDNYNDFGHNHGNDEFFKQMDFLTPELLRVLKPGKVAAIHVKDRIRYSYQNGAGFTTIEDFSGRTVAHFQKHGFWLTGKITVTTDVVRENNQTYRLGWSEQCKDATKMGVGLPEYILLFRKAPTDKSNAYADEKTSKTKEDYTRANWQLDAHAYWKSDGNRFMSADEMKMRSDKAIFNYWKKHDQNNIYNFYEHLKACETLDEQKKLSSLFMTLPPHSTHPDVWTDVNRLKTLNAKQANRKKEKHICPFATDLVERLINRFTKKGDLIDDPFGGLFTTAYCALQMGRKAISVELNPDYYDDGLFYLKSIEYKINAPTLFDLEAFTASAA